MFCIVNIKVILRLHLLAGLLERRLDETVERLYMVGRSLPDYYVKVPHRRSLRTFLFLHVL